jgi:hypothetical protein
VIEFFQHFFWGAVAGGLAALVVGVPVLLLMPRKKCPDCGALLPKLRNTWSSWKVVKICRQCGCGVDVKGRKVEE